MTEHIKTPELRFPEFKDKWNQINLKEICDITSSKRIYAKDYVRRGIPFFRGKEISSNGFKHQEDLLYISEEIYNYFSEKYGSPKEGDLLITSVGTIGNVALVPSDFKFYFKDGNLIWLKDIKMNSHFLKYYLESFQGKKRLLDKASGSNQKALTISGLESLKVNTTNNNEEIKIKNFFNKLDRQIELEEQKLAKLEEQKKGYMQQIFSQKLRFKDENGNDYPNWETEKLGNLINEVNERTKSNNQYVLLSSTKNGLLSQEEYFKKQIGSKDSTGYKVLRLNQLVLSPQNLWLGNINFNQRFDIGIVSPSYRIYNLSHHFDINFAKNLLKSPRYIYEYAQASEQGASVVRRNLNLDLFYSIKISLPSIEEQRKIGVFLNKLDKLIEKQSNEIELLKQRKKGLLQKMFV